MSINKMISIKNPIVDAMEMCGADHDKYIPVFTRWASLAEKAIGSYYQFKRKIAVLDITGCIACLPNDAAYLQRAVLGDYGCDCSDLFQRWCATYKGNTTTMASAVDSNTFLIVDMGLATTYGYNIIDHVVQDNKIVFAHNYDGQKVTIQYLAYDMDCDGFLNISENHVEAIMYNILWKYYASKKRPSNEDFYKIKLYKQEWERECANSRAKDGVLTESERDRIVSMLHDPYIGIGLGVGMYTTTGNYRW